MKNWNKIGQYIAASAGAALLASFATLATPKTASAATLSFDDKSQQWVSDNEAEAVSQIMNLEIGGKKYNVKFEEYVVGTNTDRLLLDGMHGETAATAIKDALGTSYWTLEETIPRTYRTRKKDSFHVLSYLENFSFFPGFVLTKFDMFYDVFENSVDRDKVLKQSERSMLNGQVIERVAKFEEVAEPSLIFGLITLGGLTLGRKIKNKG